MSDDEQAETDTETEIHWGARFPWGIRWDPGYGSGVYVPYTEAQARDDAQHNGGTVVTRTQTTVVTTTPWVDVSPGGADPKETRP